MSALVDAGTVAAATKVSKGFIYRGAVAGKIPHYRAGRALRFDLDEVLAWMRRQSEKELER